MSLDKITVQEAKQFIPLKENYGNTDLEHAKYFTLTPSAKGDGWENVEFFQISLEEAKETINLIGSKFK